MGMLKNSIQVSTKKELKKAIEDKYVEIIVKGELGNKLYKTKKIAYLGAGTIATLIAIASSIPFTGGIASFALAPAVALTGLEISMIIIAVSLGIVLIVAVFKDYDEISYKDGELKLKRKTSF